MIDIGTNPASLTSDFLPRSMFSVEPSTLKAGFLAQHFDNRIKASIRELTEECSRKINTPTAPNSLIERHPRLAPKVHYLHHKLQSAMRAQSQSEARLAVAQIFDELEKPHNQSHLAVISSLGSTEWEHFSKLEGSKLSSLEQRKIDSLTPVSARDLAVAKTHANEALTVIKTIDAELHGEISQHTREIKLFNSTITQSFSDVRTMGAVFIRPPRMARCKTIYYFEQLIHEMSHLQLNCIFAMDRLIVGDLARTVPSPLRIDHRPIFGVYHATYVSAKLSQALFFHYKYFKNEIVLQILAQTMNELLCGIDTFKCCPLTETGMKLFESMSHVARRVAYDSIWSSFDFYSPVQHRSKNTMFIPDRFMKFRQAEDLN